ncbi:hypothetical protein BJY54_000992 [Streptomyces nodosus]|uniref:DUF6777 domain-containing protein n=2 Tax=Streptomyces nodosus TaxID=40318 RepID=UPI00123D0A17|nr:DUF6777 domain-containing protein [Streptomyces nodosus]MBB4790380.1 hypothetical protein [Streptomyces nodosus]
MKTSSPKTAVGTPRKRGGAAPVFARAPAAVCALSAGVLLCTGCGGTVPISGAPTGGELFLQPAGSRGPDPFTDSTVRSSSAPRPAAPPQSAGGAASWAPRAVSGATPGLYGGTRSRASCDIERQIALLAADRTKARAFARAAGVDQASVAAHLRGLTSVVLRTDTRVTDHGFRAGRVTNRQSVLETGTAVLVDNRGVPRVRCASGNPIDAPASLNGTPAVLGRPWSGYRRAQVVVVTPAPRTIANITIVSIENTSTWIERRIGDDGRRDVLVRPLVARSEPPQVDVRPPRAAVEPPGYGPHDAESPPPERSGSLSEERGKDPAENGDPPHEQDHARTAGDDCETPGTAVTAAPLARTEPPPSGSAGARDTAPRRDRTGDPPPRPGCPASAEPSGTTPPPDPAPTTPR